MGRRQLLGCALSAPVRTVAAGFGVNMAAVSGAMAASPLTPSDPTDSHDIAGPIARTTLPTMPLGTIEVGANGRVRLDLPRLESGQGIAMACAMLIA
jgi:isoquinoline 1-oxidoreductase subunit beta